MLNHSFKLNELKLTYMTRHVSQIASMLEMINSAGGLSQIKNDLLNVSVLTEDADKAMLSWANSWKQLQNNMIASQGVLMNFMDGPGSMMLTLINKILGGVAKFDSKIGNSASVGMSTALTTFVGLNAFTKMTEVGKSVSEYMNIIGKISGKEMLLKHVTNNRNLTKAQRKVEIDKIVGDLKQLKEKPAFLDNPIKKLTSSIGSLAKVLMNPSVLAVLGIAAVAGVGMYAYKKRQEAIIQYEEAINDLNKALSKYNILSKQSTATQAMSKVTANQFMEWTHLSSAINSAAYALQDVISKVSDIKPIKIMASTKIDNKKLGTSEFTRGILEEVNLSKPEFGKILREVQKEQFQEYLEINKVRLEKEYYQTGDTEKKVKDKNRYELFNDFAFSKFLTEGFDLREFQNQGSKLRDDLVILKDLIEIQDSYGLAAGIMPGETNGRKYYADVADYETGSMDYKPPFKQAPTQGEYFTRYFSDQEDVKRYQEIINEKMIKTAKALNLGDENQNLKPEEILERMIANRLEININDSFKYKSSMSNVERTKIIDKANKVIEGNTLIMQKYGDAVKESIDSINGFVSAVSSRIEFLKKETTKDLENAIPTYSIAGLNKMMSVPADNQTYLGRAITDYFQGMQPILKTLGFDYNTFDLTNKEALQAIGEIKAIDDDLKNEVLFKINSVLSNESKFYDERLSGLENLSSLYASLGITDRNLRYKIKNRILDVKKNADKEIGKVFLGDSELNESWYNNLSKRLNIYDEKTFKNFYTNDLVKFDKNILHKKVLRQRLSNKEEEEYNEWFNGRSDGANTETVKKRKEIVNAMIGSVDKLLTTYMNNMIDNLSKDPSISLDENTVGKLKEATKLGIAGIIFEAIGYEDTAQVKTQIAKDNYANEKLVKIRKDIQAQRDVEIFNMSTRLEMIKLGLADLDTPINNRLDIMEEIIDSDRAIKEAQIGLEAIRAERNAILNSSKMYKGRDEDIQKLTIDEAKKNFELVKAAYGKVEKLKNLREKVANRVFQDFENITRVYESAVSRSEAVFGNVMPTFFNIRKNIEKQNGIIAKRDLVEERYNKLMNDPLLTESKRIDLMYEKSEKLAKMEIEVFDLRTEMLRTEKEMIHGMISNAISNFSKIAKGEKITIDESSAQKELADSLTALMFGRESVDSPEIKLLKSQSLHLESIDAKMAESVAYLKEVAEKVNTNVKVDNIQDMLNVPNTGLVAKEPLKETYIPDDIRKQYFNTPERMYNMSRLFNSTVQYYNDHKGTQNEVSEESLKRFLALAMHESKFGEKVIGENNFVGMKIGGSNKPYIPTTTHEFVDIDKLKDDNGKWKNLQNMKIVDKNDVVLSDQQLEMLNGSTNDFVTQIKNNKTQVRVKAYGEKFRDYQSIEEMINHFITNNSEGKIDNGSYAGDANHKQKVESYIPIVESILGKNWTNLPVYEIGQDITDYISDYNNSNVVIAGINSSATQALKNDLDLNIFEEETDTFKKIFDTTKFGNFMSITKALSSFSVILQGISNAKFAQKMKDTKADNEEFNRKFEMSIENLSTNAEKLKKKTELVNIQARQEYDMTVAEEENTIENEIVAVNKQLLDQTQKMLEYLVAIEYNTANTDSILPSQNNVYNIEQAPVEDKKSNITTFNIKSPNGTQKSIRLSGSDNTTSVPSNSFSSFIQPMLTGSLVNTAGAMLGGFGGFNLGGGIHIPTGVLSLGGYTPSFTSSFESTPSNPYALYSVFGGNPLSTGGYLDFGVPYQGGGILSSIGDTVSNATNFMSSLHPKVLGQLGGGMTALLSGLTGDPLGGGIVSGLSLLGTALSNEWSGSLIKSGIDKFYPDIAKHLGKNTLQYIGGGLSAASGGFQLGTMLANKKFDAAGVIGSGMSLAGAYSALGESALAGALGGGALGAGLATGAIALPALALGVMATNAKKRQAKYKAAGEWNKKLEKYRDEQIQEQLKALRQQQNVLSNQASQQTKAVGQNEALRRSLMSAPLTASSVELYRSHQVSKRGGALGIGRKRKKWVMEGASATVGLSDFGYSSIANISDTYSLMNNITNSMKDIQKFLDSRGQHSGSKEDRKEWAEQKARLNASQMLYDQIKGLQESIVKSTVELTQSFFGFEMIGLNKDGNKAAEDEAIAKYDIGAWEKREDLLNVFLTDFMNAGNTVGKTIADIFVSGVSNAFVKNNSQLNQVINKIENAFKNIGKKVINTDSLLEAAKYELSSGKNTSSVYQSILDQLKEAGYGSEEAHKTAQSYLDAKNYKEFVQFLESMIASGNGMGDSVKDLISATNELKETQKHLEGEMRKFVDEWVQGGGNLSDIIGSMDNILSNSAKIIANIATTGGAIEGFEALKDLLNQKVLPNVQNSIIDALKENVFDIEGQINDYKKLMEAGKLTSGSMHSMVQDMGKLFDVLENPFDFELNEQLGISDEVLQKILAYKNTIDEINNALYERMTLDEKISYNQEKLSEEASKYKTQIAKQLEQGGVIDIGALGQVSFKELEKKLQDLLAKGEPIPEELKEAIEQANGQYGTLNDTINKLEFDMRQAKVATQKFTEAWMNGLINGDYETIKSELSEETQSLLDSVIQSLNADAWDSAGTSIGSSLATSILSTYSSKLINSTQMKDTAGILNKMLFDNMNFIDNNGTVNFDMLYQLSQNAQKMSIENEATRQRFEAINSMFDYTQDIRYSKLEKDISYKTSSTKESIYNINNYNTFSIGTLVADTLGLEALTRAIAPYMISVFKDLGVKI